MATIFQGKTAKFCILCHKPVVDTVLSCSYVSGDRLYAKYAASQGLPPDRE
jgi:hypothetical protein